jgi:hypothetical protein
MVELPADQAGPILRMWPTEVPASVGLMKQAGLVNSGRPEEFEALAGVCTVFRIDPRHNARRIEERQHDSRLETRDSQRNRRKTPSQLRFVPSCSDSVPFVTCGFVSGLDGVKSTHEASQPFR